MLYLLKLYLPQLAPMDVQMETHGVKGGLADLLCMTVLTSVVGVMQAVWCLVWQKGGMGPLRTVQLRGC